MKSLALIALTLVAASLPASTRGLDDMKQDVATLATEAASPHALVRGSSLLATESSNLLAARSIDEPGPNHESRAVPDKPSVASLNKFSTSTSTIESPLIKKRRVSMSFTKSDGIKSPRNMDLKAMDPKSVDSQGVRDLKKGNDIMSSKAAKTSFHAKGLTTKGSKTHKGAMIHQLQLIEGSKGSNSKGNQGSRRALRTNSGSVYSGSSSYSGSYVAQQHKNPGLTSEEIKAIISECSCDNPNNVDTSAAAHHFCCESGASYLKTSFTGNREGSGTLSLDVELASKSASCISDHEQLNFLSRHKDGSVGPQVRFVSCEDPCLDPKTNLACQSSDISLQVQGGIETAVCIASFDPDTDKVLFDHHMPLSLPIFFRPSSGANMLATRIDTSCDSPLRAPFGLIFVNTCSAVASNPSPINLDFLHVALGSPLLKFTDGLSQGFYQAALEVGWENTHSFDMSFQGCSCCSEADETSRPTSAPSTTKNINFATSRPTCTPTNKPTVAPTSKPTTAPTTVSPSAAPTDVDTLAPTATPTIEPTSKPSSSPSGSPSGAPSGFPTAAIVPATLRPTLSPTPRPSKQPTPKTTKRPTTAPKLTRPPTTAAPTASPSASPSMSPSSSPSVSPTTSPTASPSDAPSSVASNIPTVSPTFILGFGSDTNPFLDPVCEADCIDWVYSNCNVLGPRNQVLESHCIVPLPFPFFGPGRRSLTTVNDIDLVEADIQERPVEEQILFHRKMIQVLEQVIASH